MIFEPRLHDRYIRTSWDPSDVEGSFARRVMANMPIVGLWPVEDIVRMLEDIKAKADIHRIPESVDLVVVALKMRDLGMAAAG